MVGHAIVVIPTVGRQRRGRCVAEVTHRACGAVPGSWRSSAELGWTARRRSREGRAMGGSESVSGAQVVRASRTIEADADTIFELIADPAHQPRWDGNANLAESAPGQRIRAVGDVFTMTLTLGAVRDNQRRRVRGGPPRRLDPCRPRGHAGRAPVAVGARAGGQVADRGHAHLRLVAVDRRGAVPASPGDHGRPPVGLAGPARRDRGRPFGNGSHARDDVVVRARTAGPPTWRLRALPCPRRVVQAERPRRPVITSAKSTWARPATCPRRS